MAINRNNRKQEPIPVVPRTLKIVNADGTVTRSGQLLLEQLQEVSGAGPFIRTLDLFDVTPGIGIAPFVPIFREGPGIRAIGVLRLPITSDLVIVISRNDETAPLFTFTFPADTATGVDLVQDISHVNFQDLDVLIPTILESDSSSDIDGIATLTIEWGALGDDDSGRGGSNGGGGGGGGGGFTAGGDLSGSSTIQTVIGLAGVPIDTATVGAPTNGQVITFDGASGKYQAKTPSGGGGGGSAGYYIGGIFIGSQPNLNLIQGSNVTLGGAEDAGASRVNVTINAIVPVTSVFGRTGAIIAQSGDYDASKITNAVDKTVAYADPPWITSLSWAKITGAPAVGVSSVFGRSGAVVASTGDYSASQITNAIDATQTYSNPSWLTSLAWSKITGAPTFMLDPMTTKGDLIGRTTTAPTRIPVGSDGQILSADSTHPAGIRWVPAPSGGGGTGIPIYVDGVLIGYSGTISASVVGFTISAGTTGTNVGPMLPAARVAQFTRCVVVTKTSDPSTALQFVIKKNGVSVFASAPTIAAGTATGTVSTFTGLTTVPFPVNDMDVFTLDIIGGTSSWQFTAQLE